MVLLERIQAHVACSSRRPQRRGRTGGKLARVEGAAHTFEAALTMLSLDRASIVWRKSSRSSW